MIKKTRSKAWTAYFEHGKWICSMNMLQYMIRGDGNKIQKIP
jgi:hypothetical protein